MNSLTDFFPFPLPAVRDSIPFFFERRLGCQSSVLTSYAIPQKIQSDLKSKGIAESERLVRLIAHRSTKLNWQMLQIALNSVLFDPKIFILSCTFHGQLTCLCLLAVRYKNCLCDFCWLFYNSPR